MPPINPRKPQRRALLIGICYKHTHQDDWSELLLTHRDVDRFRALLNSRYHYADDEITVMKDDEAVPSRLWPTAQNIRRELDRLVRGAAAGDQLVLLFCGHSDQLDTEETKDKTEEDGQDELIIACDAKRIVDNELKYRLVTSLHAGVNLTAIFDSCHSGTLLDLPHHHCNQIYVPWLSTGRRRTRTMQYQITRRFARITQSFALPDPDPAPAPAPASAQHNASPPLPLSPPRPAPALLSLVRLSIDTRVRAPRKHARFFGSPARGAPSPAQLDSPVQYDSPVGLYACDGWCKPWDGCGSGAGAVVSLSSCSDLQQSWESDVGSMTTMLCEFLEKHPTGAPCYREVMSHVNFELHAVARQLHAWTRAGKKENNPCAAEGEMRSFQTPELSSLVKLDMEAPFRLGLQDEPRAG